MALDRLPRPTETSLRLTPVEPGSAPLFCFALLTISCALASFAFACATPFAAFAVVAAAMLPLVSALAVVTGAWLVNQVIGFGVLHYPVDANTILWGFAIGLAALRRHACVRGPAARLATKSHRARLGPRPGWSLLLLRVYDFRSNAVLRRRRRLYNPHHRAPGPVKCHVAVWACRSLRNRAVPLF